MTATKRVLVQIHGAKTGRLEKKRSRWSLFVGRGGGEVSWSWRKEGVVVIFLWTGNQRLDSGLDFRRTWALEEAETTGPSCCQNWLNKITKQPIQVQGIPVIYSAGDNDKSLKEFQPDLSRLVSNVAGLICTQSGPVPRFRLTGTKRRKAGLG
ncbi:hypothetical protein BDBG_00948 [Blastomyces gilchristii SLH14081]|uniref:Uncharacterized protein n=1 Tax=Blastomyces gilchristii (strain SLH14081) TaxID=559298 RepID=A0A179UAP2_BLAGS|nr:uncharacterized protein BDBG_00948 [Blastomyces gilchristii SLH14081]OAT04378.1 hypothetical protein BDBG_00948 [Blastomyces gilchristii SLH14081]